VFMAGDWGHCAAVTQADQIKRQAPSTPIVTLSACYKLFIL